MFNSAGFVVSFGRRRTCVGLGTIWNSCTIINGPCMVFTIIGRRAPFLAFCFNRKITTSSTTFPRVISQRFSGTPRRSKYERFWTKRRIGFDVRRLFVSPLSFAAGAISPFRRSRKRTWPNRIRSFRLKPTKRKCPANYRLAIRPYTSHPHSVANNGRLMSDTFLEVFFVLIDLIPPHR